MRYRKHTTRKRRFKRTAQRKLSFSDLTVLDFLWTWKVASAPMLSEVAFRGKSAWWAYKALRQLKKEKYIELLPRGKNLDLELWTLTDHGFEIVLMDRDDIKEYRYRVHAPAHDYLATCLQLGDLWQSGIETRFFTEQMLASLAPSNFPKDFRNVPEHVPDGMTIIPDGLKDIIIGYEVDLNLKDPERYEHTYQYYKDGPQTQLIVWLVRNPWIAGRIQEALGRREYSEQRKEEILRKIVFILTDDFKENVWEAKIINGVMKGNTLRKAHANLVQRLGKLGANTSQKPMREIFFPKFKSPQKLTTYKKEDPLENC
jgi:hypothetical protein